MARLVGERKRNSRLVLPEMCVRRPVKECQAVRSHCWAQVCVYGTEEEQWIEWCGSGVRVVEQLFQVGIRNNTSCTRARRCSCLKLYVMLRILHKANTPSTSTSGQIKERTLYRSVDAVLLLARSELKISKGAFTPSKPVETRQQYPPHAHHQAEDKGSVVEVG